MPIDPLTRWRLGRDLTWALVVKLAALGLLWALFFSAKHHPAADAAAIGHRLAVDAVTKPALQGRARSGDPQ